MFVRQYEFLPSSLFRERIVCHEKGLFIYKGGLDDAHAYISPSEASRLAWEPTLARVYLAPVLSHVPPSLSNLSLHFSFQVLGNFVRDDMEATTGMNTITMR